MTKYIITCAARTGSTMLRHVLNDHPEVVCHGEIFELARTMHFYKWIKVVKFDHLVNQKIQKLFESNTKSFLNEVAFSGVDLAVKACGFKYKTDEFYNKKFLKISNLIKGDKDIKVIHLKRNDLLEQYVSFLLVNNQKSPTFVIDNESPLVHEPFDIDLGKLELFLEDVTLREQAIESDMVGHDIINVTYEELISNRAVQMNRLFSFLGAEPRDIGFRTRKIVKNHNKLIKNREAVDVFFRESRFSHRISSS